MRVFLSYAHADCRELAERIAGDLEGREYAVFFDRDDLRAGDDWERVLERELSRLSADDCGRFVLLMTPLSVGRRGGYSRNETTRAQELGIRVVPVMVDQVAPPLALAHLHRLDMTRCLPLEENESRYRARFERLVAALEAEEPRTEFPSLRRFLEPLAFEADMAQHLPRFSGREWFLAEIDEWLADAGAERTFWILGDTGIGKSAIASWLCHHREELAAFHLFRHGDARKSDPASCIRSIAYQLATQFPELQEHLSGLDLRSLASESSPRTLFDALIAEPLATLSIKADGPRTLLLDAVDEAAGETRNELAELIATEFLKTPPWLRLILTSRPDPRVMRPLQGLTPRTLEPADERNLEDLRGYLEGRLGVKAGGQPTPPAAIERIVERSEGSFLYVAWVCEEVRRGRLTLDQPAELPKGLGGIYLQFFSRQFPEIEAYGAEILPVLELVSASREPLSTREIASILDWDEYRHRRLPDDLGPLFPVVQERIRPFHGTVMEWLSDRARAGAYFVDRRGGHGRLADAGWQAYRRGPETMSRYALRHLALHLMALGRDDEATRLLTDLRFIAARSAAGMTTALVADYDRAGLVGYRPGPPIRTARDWRDKLGLHCPFCLGWNEVRSSALGKALSCPECDRRLQLNPFTVPGDWHSSGSVKTPPAEDEPALRAGGAMADYARFVRRRIHFLGEFPDLVVQEAANGPDESTVTRDAHEILEGTGTRRPWLRWINKSTLPEPCVMTRFGHSGAVNACTFSPDGKDLLSASEDGTLKIWDVAAGSEIRTLSGHVDAVNSCSYSPGGRRILSGSDDATVRIWDATTGETLRVLDSHEGPVNSCAFSLDGRRIASASDDKTIRLWDAATGDLLCKKRGKMFRSAVRFSPDGGWLADGGDNYLYRREACDISPDGERVASAIGFTLRSAANLRSLATSAPAGEGNPVSKTRAGEILPTRSGPGELWLRDAKTANDLEMLLEHDDRVTACVFSPDGRRLVSGSEDQNIIIWDAEAAEHLASLPGHRDGVSACAFSPDGRYVVSGSRDGSFRLWDVAAAVERSREIGGPEDPGYSAAARQQGVGYPYSACAFSPDGFVVAYGSDLDLNMVRAESGEVLASWRDEYTGFRASALSFSPTRRCVAVGSDYQAASMLPDDYEDLPPETKAFIRGELGTMDRIRLWGLLPEVNPFLLQLDETWRVTGCAFSPDGSRLASSACIDDFLSGYGEGYVRIWDLTSGEVLLELSGHENMVTCCAYGADGRHVVSGSFDGTLKIWDAVTGDQLQVLEGHGGHVRACAFSPDGRRIVSGADVHDGAVSELLKIWDAVTGQELQTLTGHGDSVTACIFSPDGCFVLSTSVDGTLRIWDWAAGQLRALFRAENILDAVAMAKDRIAVRDCGGRLFLLQPVHLALGPPITTAKVVYCAVEKRWDARASLVCGRCGQAFYPDDEVLTQIEAVALEHGAGGPGAAIETLSPAAWKDPRLTARCEHCEGELRLNPFVVDARAVEAAIG